MSTSQPLSLPATALALFSLLAAACGPGPGAPPSPAPSAPAGVYERELRAARLSLGRGDLEAAVARARAAAESAPERPEAYGLWGRALAAQNQLGAAAERYERARALGSDDRQVFVELTSVYDVIRAYDKAVVVYGDWLGRHPTDAEMQHELGLTLLLLERFGEAALALEAAARVAPGDLQVKQDQGYALLRAHDADAAAVALALVVAAEPARVEALRLLAQARAAQGRSAEALALLDRALAADAGEARARRVRARLRQLLGDDAGALADYRALLEADPQDGPALLGAAGALLALGREDEAEPLVTRARAALGDLPEVRLRAAQLAWRRGDRAAVAALRELARALPHAAEIWRDLDRAAERFGDRRLRDEARRQLAAPR